MESAFFYCHDTFGLGHLRRTLSLVEALQGRRPDLAQLVATGSPLAHVFRLPDHVDYLKLPSIAKVGRGYAARLPSTPLEDVTAMRANILTAAATYLRPQLVVVDNVPAGLRGELIPALHELRRSRGTRLVLGLRDIVDEPERVRRAWTRDGSYELLDHVYDRILIYGQPDVFDVVTGYGFSAAAAAKTRYVGYIRRLPAAYRAASSDRLVVVTAGGGGDGFPLLRAAIESCARMRTGARWRVVTGPFVSARERDALARLAKPLDQLELSEFERDLPALIANADVVVSMGGYNSVCEILSARRPAVIVPRVEPRLEQLLRARALERRGLARVVHPDDLTASELASHVDALLTSGSRGGEAVDLAGLDQAAAELDALITAATPALARGVS